jgi:hypothetical protein
LLQLVKFKYKFYCKRSFIASVLEWAGKAAEFIGMGWRTKFTVELSAALAILALQKARTGFHTQGQWVVPLSCELF